MEHYLGQGLNSVENLTKLRELEAERSKLLLEKELD
jgi:hypothetical protein